ncbi:MAG TPA: acetate/propionate family kinase [Steroidobacteraceae bacterium]|jgi:acetate kinase|nr:acetate/propionate family kinase [Steroidobacteraceae bacterium]
MREPILIINAGSSSLKFSVFETLENGALAPKLHGQVETVGSESHLRVADASGKSLADERIKRGGDEAIRALQHWFAAHTGTQKGFAGVGHRIVHGGTTYSQPVLIDGSVMAGLQQLVPLAPLHEPQQIAAIRAIRATSPHLKQVACFDTAFHSNQPPIARMFALPREYTARGIRRYGFHGLSYEYIVAALPALAPECVGARLIVAHLGNGASLCAIHQGQSIATTMGFTALDGLVMGTRCGSLDPGVLLYLLQHEHLGAAEIERLLYERSGLLGVSGVSSDMRELLASDRPEAAEAVELFVYRISRELGSLASALGGVDALIFTGGIGEHAAPIRARVCQQAAWLGVTLDASANDRGERRICDAGSRVSAWVIPTDENLMVARHTRRLLDAAAVRTSAT